MKYDQSYHSALISAYLSPARDHCQDYTSDFMYGSTNNLLFQTSFETRSYTQDYIISIISNRSKRVMPSSSPGLYIGLNSDALSCILDVLQHDRSLLSFSSTCRHIRVACMPILFRVCKVSIYTFPENFPPQTLWPHIQ